jgi:hypothetical protein
MTRDAFFILRESSSAVEKAGSYFDKEPSHSDIEKLLEPLLNELEKIHDLYVPPQIST